VILVVLYSVAIRWVRQDAVSVATFNRIENRKHYLRTEIRTLKVRCFQIEDELSGSCSNRWCDEECVQEFGWEI
jgi:hypothetical protein